MHVFRGENTFLLQSGPTQRTAKETVKNLPNGKYGRHWPERFARWTSTGKHILERKTPAE